MDDLISKRELLTNLIHCKGLGRASFQSLIDFLEDYPIDVNMERIKEQISEMDIPLYETKVKKDIINILDKGGV